MKNSHRLSAMLSRYISYGITYCVLACLTYIYAESSDTAGLQDFMMTLSRSVGLTAAENSITQQDMSLFMLGNIFGNVAGLVASGQQTLIANIFRIFNLGIIGFSALTIGYSSITEVITSSAEGAAMGKKLQQSQYFLIFRQITSVAMATPQVSGYSTIQVMMMWIVIQGVYLADVVWLKSAEYVMSADSYAAQLVAVLNSNIPLGSNATTLPVTNNTALFSYTLPIVTSMYQYTLCASLAPYVPDSMSKIAVMPYTAINIVQNSETQYSIVFPYGCGTLYVQGPSGTAPETVQSLLNVVNSALNNIVTAISPVVYAMQDNAYPQCLSTLSAGASATDIMTQCTSSAQNNCNVSLALLDTAELLAMQIQTILDGAAQTASSPTTPAITLQQLYGVGWMGIATQYYNGVSVLQKSTNTFPSIVLTNYLSATPPGGTPSYASSVTSDVSAYGNILGLGIPSVPTGYTSGSFDASSNVFCQPLLLPSAAPVAMTTNCDMSDTATPFMQWYCTTAPAVQKQAVGVVYNMWNNNSPYFSGIFSSLMITESSNNQTLDTQMSFYLNQMSSLTENVPTWMAAAPYFWPLMNTFTVATTNAWINTFINPNSLVAMVIDPIHTFSQFSIFLVQASMQYIFQATSEVAADMFLFAESAAAATIPLAITSVMVDGVLTLLQQDGYILRDACFMPADFLFPLPAFCYPFFINIIAGLIVVATSTILRLIIKAILDTTMGVLLQTIQISIAYKMRFISLVFFVSVPVLTVASYFAVYIPMLPVIMYTIAVMGWFIAVIESMIGVPLVLLGMTSMTGNDLLGSAQQTFIMLLSVFIRPVTLVIGFMFGVINLSLFGLVMAIFIVPYLGNLMNNMTVMNVDALSQGVILAIFMVVYLSVFAIVIQLAFGAMFRIPYAVLRWIGAQGVSSGEEEILEQIQSETRAQINAMAGVFQKMQGGLGKTSGAAQTASNPSAVKSRASEPFQESGSGKGGKSK